MLNVVALEKSPYVLIVYNGSLVKTVELYKTFIVVIKSLSMAVLIYIKHRQSVQFRKV